MNNTTTTEILVVCKTCSRELPATTKFFHKKKDNKNGLRYTCKKCRKKEKKYHKPYIESKKLSEIERKKRNDKSKRYYEKNKDKILRNKKEYRKTEKYKLNRKKYSEKYYQNNKQLIKTKVKEYKRTEKGKFIQSVSSQKRKTRLKNLAVNFSNDDWYNCLEFFERKCAYCGKVTQTLQKEHVIPTIKGGGYIKSNIIPSCMECNYNKHTHDLDYWYPKYKYFDENRYKKIKKYVKGSV